MTIDIKGFGGFVKNMPKNKKIKAKKTKNETPADRKERLIDELVNRADNPQTIKGHYFVDLPILDGEGGDWKSVEVEFPSKEAAIAFCRRNWKADSEGRVNLVTFIVDLD